MNDLKNFYRSYHDEIIIKRAESPYLLRRYVHQAQYASILRHVKQGMRVLDAGCGEGVLSVLMAEKGAIVTGCDLSEPNVLQSRRYAHEKGVSVEFLVGDAESLPFSDYSFDLVVSSHVLEHLPDFDKGLSEIMRVTKKRAIIAIPTLINGCSWVQVGGGWFYLKGIRSFVALPLGFLKMIWAYVLGREGVDEIYAGQGMPHIFRFPHIMYKKVKAINCRVVIQESSSVCFPYFSSTLPLIRLLDRYRDSLFLRNLGYGTTYVIEKTIDH